MNEEGIRATRAGSPRYLIKTAASDVHIDIDINIA